MTTQLVIPGDCIEGMKTLPDSSVHCCVTSPPYWGLRDYGHDGQIGLESTPEAYVARIVEVFREVRRVLREDGTLWLNLGDSYAGSWGAQSRGGPPSSSSTLKGNGHIGGGPKIIALSAVQVEAAPKGTRTGSLDKTPGLKAKDLVGIPWRVAFALQADGWYLRQDIIWHKPNPMPESVRDRCTKAHEYVFLLTKSQRYFYDAEAVSEAVASSSVSRLQQPTLPEQAGSLRVPGKTNGPMKAVGGTDTRNRRSVWTVTTKPYSGAHFATMPPDLVEPCIKAGSPEGGTVLDPFAGSGTTLAVAASLGRNAWGCELNPAYIALAEKRIAEARSSVALFEEVR